MDDKPTIDEAIDTALDLLETDTSGQAEKVVLWLVDNLICELEVHQSGSVSRCDVAGYQVCRVGEQIAVFVPNARVLDSHAARELAVALLRAAEAAEQVT